VFYTCADPSDCAVKGMGLRSLVCLDCGFLSLREHGCLSVVNAECSKAEALCAGLITLPEDSYWVWRVRVWSRIPNMRKLVTSMSCCAMESVTIYVIQSCPPTNTGHTACLSFILTCFFSAVLCIIYILIYFHYYTVRDD